MSETELGKAGGVVRTIVETVSDEITRINQEIDRLDKVVRVADRAARDAIPTADRYEGLWVEVLGEAKVYRLTDGLTNDHWQERVGMSAVGVPIASADQYGVVKIGSGIDRTEDGVISVPEVDIATSKVAGLVKGGGNITIAADGTLSVPDVANATQTVLGKVRFATAAEVTAGTLTTVALAPVDIAGLVATKTEIITASKTWTAPKTGWVSVLCVGGGGGGGGGGPYSSAGYPGGGGSGGGYSKSAEGFIRVTKGQNLNAVVGAGGNGGAVNTKGGGGGQSSFGGVVAGGGAGGGRGKSGASTVINESDPPGDGGVKGTPGRPGAAGIGGSGGISYQQRKGDAFYGDGGNGGNGLMVGLVGAAGCVILRY